jgi:hypothetical protein
MVRFRDISPLQELASLSIRVLENHGRHSTKRLEISTVNEAPRSDVLLPQVR